MKRGQRLSLRVKAVEDEEEKGSWKVKRWEKERRLHPDVKKENCCLGDIVLFCSRSCSLISATYMLSVAGSIHECGA